MRATAAPSTGKPVGSSSPVPQLRTFAFYAPGCRNALHVRTLGLVDEVTKHALLAEASALLLPSRTDSLGIVMLEAWSHGTPVIGAAAGGIPGVVDHGENGLLVPFGDVAALAGSVRLLVTDGELRRRLGEQGREKVARRYTWSQVRDRVLDSYRQLLD